jgi:hypothetical protein
MSICEGLNLDGFVIESSVIAAVLRGGALRPVVLPFEPEVSAGERLQLGPNHGRSRSRELRSPSNGEQSRDLARLGFHASSPSRGSLRKSPENSESAGVLRKELSLL